MVTEPLICGRRPRRPRRHRRPVAARTHRMRTLAALAGLLVGAACSNGAPGADHPPPTTATASTPPTVVAPADDFGTIGSEYEGTGPKVALLGDSISVRSREQVREALSGYSLKVGAVRGEGLSGGSISRALGGGSMLDVAAQYAKDPPEVLVLELGTNDAWLAPLSAEDATAAVETIVGEFPSSCVVAVTITEVSTAKGYDRGEARRINRSVRSVADQIVEWGTESTGRPGLLLPDGIHPTGQGSEVLAAGIADGVRSCPP